MTKTTTSSQQKITKKSTNKTNLRQLNKFSQDPSSRQLKMNNKNTVQFPFIHTNVTTKKIKVSLLQDAEKAFWKAQRSLTRLHQQHNSTPQGLEDAEEEFNKIKETCDSAALWLKPTLAIIRLKEILQKQKQTKTSAKSLQYTQHLIKQAQISTMNKDSQTMTLCKFNTKLPEKSPGKSNNTSSNQLQSS